MTAYFFSVWIDCGAELWHVEVALGLPCIPDRHADIECAPADGGGGLDRRSRVGPTTQCTWCSIWRGFQYLNRVWTRVLTNSSCSPACRNP